jgi:hypothetical protein
MKEFHPPFGNENGTTPERTSGHVRNRVLILRDSVSPWLAFLYFHIRHEGFLGFPLCAFVTFVVESFSACPTWRAFLKSDSPQINTDGKDLMMFLRLFLSRICVYLRSSVVKNALRNTL